jgi:amino acid permease
MLKLLLLFALMASCSQSCFGQSVSEKISTAIEANDKILIYINRRLSNKKAIAYCSSLNGRLAVIESDNENKQVKDKFLKFSTSDIWINAYDGDSEKSFIDCFIAFINFDIIFSLTYAYFKKNTLTHTHK